MNEGLDTRAALLESARNLFAERGYAGTSVRAITARAGANLGAITYHFGAKEKLYEVVLQSLAEPLALHVRTAAERAACPLDGVEAVVRALFTYQVENPAWPALVLRQLTLDRPIPVPIQNMLRDNLASISRLIRAGQRDGSIVRGDPTLLTFSVVAQPIYAALVRRHLRGVLGVDLEAPRAHRQFVDHLVRFVRRSLATQGRNR